MPTYSIMNKMTNEKSEVNMKYEDFQIFLSQNPHLKQIFIKPPSIGDSIRMGKKKPDDGFKDILKEVAHHHKKNSINTW